MELKLAKSINILKKNTKQCFAITECLISEGFFVFKFLLHHLEEFKMLDKW